MRNRVLSMKADRMQKYGVNPLTGEACAYGLRILCDLSQEGKELVTNWLGLREDGFLPNWNTYVGDKPSVASIMLTRSALHELCHWIIVHVEKLPVVVEGKDGTVMGLEEDNPYYLQYLETPDVWEGIWQKVFVYAKNGNSVDGRNTHQMSGRIA